ncbi:MAG: hypothetical protein ACYDA3_04530 [Gaiellaceae bacterium]
MSQVGAPVRIVALIGMLAALGVGAWTFTLGHSTGSSTPPQSAALGSVGQNPVAAAQAVAGKLSAHNTATARGLGAAASAAAAKPKSVTPTATTAAHPAATAKPTVTTPAATPAATSAKTPAAATTKDGTPTTIARLLRTYASVVVLLYDAQAPVDQYSIAEAKLGASRAHAGFITVNVMNQREAAPFTKAYGVLQDPSVLFFSRPGKLVQKLSGFADHDTVAQAAISAALGLGKTKG